MGRILDPALKAELAKDSIILALFVEIEYANGPLRAWSGIGDKLLFGDTFKGVGEFGGIGPVTESDEIRAENLNFSLSGVDPTALSDALLQSRFGKDAKAWLALLDTSEVIIGQAVQIFGGLTDTSTIEKQVSGSTIVQSAESELAPLERPRERRYTTEDQAIDFPGDKGLDFVAALQDSQVVWGGG